MAKITIIVAAFFVLAISQQGQAEEKFIIGSVAHWASTKIDLGLSAAKGYLQEFQNQSEVYIHNARVKEQEYRVELENKYSAWVLEFAQKYVEHRNYSEECSGKIVEQFKVEVTNITENANKCVDKVIEGDVLQFNGLVNSAKQGIRNLVHHKQEIADCVSNAPESALNVASTYNCLKAVARSSFEVIKGLFNLNVQFIEVIGNMAILPARESFCVGKTVYDGIQAGMHNKSALLEACPQGSS